MTWFSQQDPGVTYENTGGFKVTVTWRHLLIGDTHQYSIQCFIGLLSTEDVINLLKYLAAQYSDTLVLAGVTLEDQNEVITDFDITDI